MKVENTEKGVRVIETSQESVGDSADSGACGGRQSVRGAWLRRGAC